MNKKIEFCVPYEYDDKTLKVFLKEYCNLSSRLISQLKRENLGISRNNSLIKTIDKVYCDDIISICLPKDDNEITPVEGELSILFEDDYILIVDKPPFMPVHPTKIHQKDTLANIVSYYMQKKNEFYKFRCLNRLDKDTSGIVLIAKDKFTSYLLSKTFSKTYYAICEGTIKDDGTINKPIKVKEGKSIQRVTTESGIKAITHFRVIKNTNDSTLLEITLETGRTHQIRCHISSIGHPLCGDDMYGGHLDKINRQALHCGKLTFVHPISKQRILIESKLPFDMQKLINP